MDPTRKTEWEILKVVSAKPRQGRRHDPAIQISTSKAMPFRLSYGIGVIIDGEFRSRSFIDDRDVVDYLELLRDMATWVKQEVSPKFVKGLQVRIGDRACAR
jgi:hypothetical protein